ncbi:MAG: 4Fe-4S cluster-binding domain-containing protein [Clostridiaceae bacterium]|nr:4Fe-4S cluster-binding domain-containing protein [Clostridiaceae bacterium]
MHSIESLSTCDGPGLRQVIFLQGCPLRCSFCHNPDSWSTTAGQLCTAESVLEKISRFSAYSSSNGGVTISGGEPLFQPCFLLELLFGLKLRGINTAIDTSGWPHQLENDCLLTAILAQTDLLLLDIKSPDSAEYKLLTGTESTGRDHVIYSAIICQTSTWLRHVVLPGLNTSSEAISKLANWIYEQHKLGLKMEKVSLLPYHRLGLHKYEELGLKYSLRDMPAMSDNEMDQYKQKLNRTLASIMPDIPLAIE